MFDEIKVLNEAIRIAKETATREGPTSSIGRWAIGRIAELEAAKIRTQRSQSDAKGE